MTKIQKETIYQILAEKICKAFGISDDNEPTVIVQGCENLGEFHIDNVRAEIKGRGFHSVENLIIIRPSEGEETLAHELAHFVQYHLEGDTICHCMNNNRAFGERDYKMAVRHEDLSEKIQKLF